MVCRVCQSPTSRPLFSKYGFPIVTCSSCNLVFTDFQPTPAFFKKFYSQTYFQNGSEKRSYQNYGAEADALKTTFAKRFASLNLLKTGKVLDIGCAYGFFLQVIPDSWSKFGVEVSNHAAQVAQKINPKAVISNTKNIPPSFLKHRFDLVTLWDVIEHLDQPADIIATSHRLLKKGGVLALTTGDVRSLFARLQGEHWHLYNPPQHLSYFSPQTITRLLTASGFTNIKISHPASYYPLAYLLHKLKSLYHLPLPLPNWSHKIILPVNLGDIMLVTATKKG